MVASLPAALASPHHHWPPRRAALAALAALASLALAAHVLGVGRGAPPPPAPLHTAFSWDSCAPADPQIIVYNRIPKAGSTTLIALLKRAAEANGFALVLPEPYYDHEASKTAILEALRTERRTVVCNHFNFPEILYADRISYINVMRDPIDRCASYYYYTRYGDRNRDLKKDTIEQYGGATLDECAASRNLASCLNCDVDTQAQAFCGREGGPCANATQEEVLRRAWDNVRAHYFVGVTEDLGGTIATLEALYPSFFKGMTVESEGIKPQKVTSKREEFVAPGEAARRAVAGWVAADEELYRRVKERYGRMRELCEARGKASRAGGRRRMSQERAPG